METGNQFSLYEFWHLLSLHCSHERQIMSTAQRKGFYGHVNMLRTGEGRDYSVCVISPKMIPLCLRCVCIVWMNVLSGCNNIHQRARWARLPKGTSPSTETELPEVYKQNCLISCHQTKILLTLSIKTFRKIYQKMVESFILEGRNFQTMIAVFLNVVRLLIVGEITVDSVNLVHTG